MPLFISFRTNASGLTVVSATLGLGVSPVLPLAQSRYPQESLPRAAVQDRMGEPVLASSSQGQQDIQAEYSVDSEDSQFVPYGELIDEEGGEEGVLDVKDQENALGSFTPQQAAEECCLSGSSCFHLEDLQEEVGTFPFHHVFQEASVSPVPTLCHEEGQEDQDQVQEANVSVPQRMHDAAVGVFANDKFEQKAQTLATTTLLTGRSVCRRARDTQW